MFGPPGRLYTYRSHGIHVCANVACGPAGTAAAVLLRAAAVESGVEFAAARRGLAVRPAALARGPGNLCSALGITMGDNGADVFDPSSAVTVQFGAGDRRAAARGWGSAGPRTGRGGSGSPDARRCRRFGAVPAPRPGESD